MLSESLKITYIGVHNGEICAALAINLNKKPIWTSIIRFNYICCVRCSNLYRVGGLFLPLFVCIWLDKVFLNIGSIANKKQMPKRKKNSFE